MPNVFEKDGFRFFFFSNEGTPREPVHVHIRKAEKLAKFWIEPEITLADSYALGSRELKMLENIVRENKLLITSKWHDFFGD